MNPHQMMLNFCRQHFQTNANKNVYFGHRKRICQNCGLPICRKILDINDFLPRFSKQQDMHMCAKSER